MNKLDSFSFNIISLFSANSGDTTSYLINEDFNEVKVSTSFNIGKIDTTVDFKILTKGLNVRDTFHISFLKEGEVIENFSSQNNDDLSSFIEEINNNVTEGDKIDLELTIIKNPVNSVISIYYLSHFTHYLNSLSFSVFLNVIEKYLNGEKLVFENQQQSDKTDFSTQTISFGSSADGLKSISSKNRQNKVYGATNLCHWDCDNKNLLPEDIYPIVSDKSSIELTKIFSKCGLLYTMMFIFDYTSIKDDSFLYKLNGYKTFGEKIITLKVSDIGVDSTSFNLVYKIYQWIYSGGNTNDKLSIARNILSLNFDPKTLQISPTAFDSILSNYKIYERQNVKQYIEVRNKLSEILIDLQGNIDKICNRKITMYQNRKIVM